MTTADGQWQQFYRQLHQFQQSPVPLAIDSALQQADKLIEQWLNLAEHHPATIIAQLNLTPRQLDLSAARLLKHLALGLFFAWSYGWQVGRSKQLLQALILPGAFSLQASSSQHATLLAAKALQQFNKQHPLLPLLLSACHTKPQTAWQLHPDGSLLQLLNQLALLLLPTAGSPLSLEQLFASPTLNQPQVIATHWFGILQQLANSKALPGRFAKSAGREGQSQHYWFICGVVSQPDMLPSELYTRQFDPATKTISANVLQQPLAELKLLNPQYFRDPDWLTLLEPDPEVLLQPSAVDLQQSLAQSLYTQISALSLNAQVEVLQRQPLVSQFLLNAAQQISRQQLPVNRLRHAISMLGQEALSDWLAQAELHQYCTHLAHPHHSWLEQLQQCLQQALLLLSEQMQQPIAQSQTGLIARCATLSLWQQSTTANIALGRHALGQLLLGQLIQQHIWQAADYPELASQLLSHYQQPQWSSAIQGWHKKPPAKLTVLLRLSWQLSLAVFCASEQNQQRLAILLPVASAHLGLPLQPAEFWQQQLMAASHCYYPLPAL